MSPKRHHSRLIPQLTTGALSAFFCASSLAADVQQDNTLDTIIATFKAQTTAWEPIIYDLTLSLFWGLVIISFTWTFIQMVIKDGVGLVDVIAELTRRVLLIGFSIWMMDNAPDLARTLIKSFTEIGTRISGGAVAFSPSNVLELGINIMSIAWEQSSLGDIGGSLAMILASLVIIVCFAIMAMDMTIVIVSGFVIVSGGIVAMGFLGSDWTRDNAINYFTAVLGVAFKMFVMQLIFVMGYSIIQDWGASMSSESQSTDYLALLGVCIVFAGLMREIPQMASSLASGRFTMAGGGIQAAGKTIGSVAAGAALLAGGAGMAAASQMMNSAGGNDSDSPPPSTNDEATTNAHTFDTGQGDTSNYMPPEFQQAAATTGGGGSAQDTGSPEPSGMDEAHSQSFDTGQGDNDQAFTESRTESSSGTESSTQSNATAQSGESGTAASSDPSPSSSAEAASASSANASPTDSPEVGASSNTPDSKPEPTRTQKALSTAASGAKSLAIGSAKVTGKVANAGLHAMATRTAFGAMLAEGAKKLGERPVDMNTAAMEDIARQLNASVTPPPAPTDINSPHFEDYLSPDKSDVKEENQDSESEEKPTQE